MSAIALGAEADCADLPGRGLAAPVPAELSIGATSPRKAQASASHGALAYAAVLIAGIGVLWREWWVLIAHPPAHAIYSDMSNYCHLALRLTDPGYYQGPRDTVQAAGMSFYLAFWHLLSGSWSAATFSNLALCIAIPPLVAWVAWQLYGARVAWIALIIASLHFPLIDYGGYFLAETPFTALLIGGVGLMLQGHRQAATSSRLLWSFAGGMCFGLAAAPTSPGMQVAGACVHWLARQAWQASSSRMAWSGGVLLAGAAAACLPMMLRTSALVGHPAFVSTNGPLNVLIGHYDPQVGTFSFVQRGANARWSSPSAMQSGAHKTLVLRFADFDQASCLDQAWSWIRVHPAGALALSVEHVIGLYDLRTYPWPTASTRWRGWTHASELLGLFLVTLPALLVACSQLRSGDGQQRRGAQLLTLITCCLWLTVFLTSSEPRYRVPFDTFAIILAACLYARLGQGAGPRPLEEAA